MYYGCPQFGVGVNFGSIRIDPLFGGPEGRLGNRVGGLLVVWWGRGVESQARPVGQVWWWLCEGVMLCPVECSWGELGEGERV